jgi:cell filamentation protein
MYDAVPDRYCYPGTTVLRNIQDIRDQASLDKFEAAITAQRADEPLPAGRMSVTHYKAIHHHLFQDVYVWAGRFRSVRIYKDGSAFCFPENIEEQMRRLFASLADRRSLRGLSYGQFAAAAASFLSTLIAVHPFREGNGRTQTTFLALLADQADHPLDLEKLEPRKFLAAWSRASRAMTRRSSAQSLTLSADFDHSVRFVKGGLKRKKKTLAPANAQGGIAKGAFLRLF